MSGSATLGRTVALRDNIETVLPNIAFPIPGIDPTALQEIMSTNQKGLIGMFNVFAGGAISRMAIFALGIMPYISSSIIIGVFLHEHSSKIIPNKK